MASAPLSLPVRFTIASSTPHSGNYAPENIVDDKPMDPSSRWSGAFQGNANQWIVLRLDSLAVLKTITFGKFSKPHPCNVKELKVFVGATEDHMSEILHAGLKNDHIPETFVLNHVNSAGITFPTQYVKIIPIMAHGQNFHISIWHVSLTGIIEHEYVERIRLNYEEYRETSVLRYVLKHLRQRRLLSPYQSILTRANVHLEHPLVTKLHESLVLQGDWTRTEQLLDEISSSGLFDVHLRSCQPYSEWTRLTGTDADGDVPPARGGHAMCMDPVNEMIYIFGGWSGEKSLDDFWVYSIKDDKWKVLSHSTTDEQNAPGARSCHKMVFDTKTGSIYVLGRLNDADGLRAPAASSPRAPPRAGLPAGHPAQPPQAQAQPQPQAQPPPPQDSTPATNAEAKMYSSEFYRYHTSGLLAGKWDFLSIDTAASGGPPLIFDHQMVMDSEAQILYVFGGRVVDGDWDVSKYSGLYSYNVSTSKWKLLQHAPPPVPGPGEPPHMYPRHPPDTSLGSTTIPSRFGHSMVLDPTTKTLYIFAGQREDKYLSDMFAYDIKTGTSTEIFSNFSTAGGPEACFTQRAVVDPMLKEIYVFCGLTRTSSTMSSAAPRALRDHLLNWVYRYESRPGKWMQILREKDKPASERPMPRFAHQVVYNPIMKTVYLHGGNAGSTLGAGGASAGGRTQDGDGVPYPEAEDPKEASTSTPAGAKERLDDFWKMVLKRPGPEEIIRRGKFMIRKQQFREMCEEMPPIKALGFLQKEVASVVNHKLKDEEEQFRSLLTHLLSPQPPTPPTAETPTQPSRVPSTSSSSHHSRPGSTSIEHEDSREGSPRPRKRSRGESTSEDGGGVWTNELPPSAELDELVTSSSNTSLRFGASGIRHLRETTDPLEAVMRGEHAREARPLSGARYAQRTEVFEALLKFVEEEEKQPEESLLDLVEKDRMTRVFWGGS